MLRIHAASTNVNISAVNVSSRWFTGEVKTTTHRARIHTNGDVIVVRNVRDSRQVDSGGFVRRISALGAHHGAITHAPADDFVVR